MFKEVFTSMGIIKLGGLDSNILTGTVGPHTYRYTNRQLVVSQKAAEVSDRRSYEQIAHRSLMPNVSLTAKLLTTAAFKFAFEDKNAGQTDYNMFFKHAMRYSDPVYITKDMREMKICVPTGYEISRGSLKKVVYTYNASEHAFVTNLSASAVNADTTVEEFSIDFLAQNKPLRWKFEDKIVYVMLTGTMGDDGYVRFEVSGASLMFSLDDTAKLSAVLPAMKIVDGKVAIDAATYSCAAIIHVRYDGEGNVLVSSQSLVLSDALKTYAAAYQTAAAKEAAMRSIGGWNDSLIGSKASTSIYDGEVVRDNENGSNENENQNGNNGGGSSSEPQTLAAPVISGETPFAESTTVSMSGPDGAEIRYTTDGSTPTAESTLYSEAITLSDTTTVKAIAIKDGNSSQVSTKEFSKSDGGGNGGSGMDQN